VSCTDTHTCTGSIDRGVTNAPQWSVIATQDSGTSTVAVANPTYFQVTAAEVVAEASGQSGE